MWITKTSVNQPVFATMVMLALVVLGLYSYRLLPVEEMPEIVVPQAYVTVSYPGASPEAIENDVIKPLENVINGVDGVKNIYSTAREGNAFLMIDFRMETDAVAATQEVRDKVAQIRDSLPEDVREGDWIEIDRVGAYSNALASRFNGFYPETLVVVRDKPAGADLGVP